LSRGDRSRQARERTAEDRERDRQERALRRAEKEGRDPAAEPDPAAETDLAVPLDPVAPPDGIVQVSEHSDQAESWDAVPEHSGEAEVAPAPDAESAIGAGHEDAQHIPVGSDPAGYDPAAPAPPGQDPPPAVPAEHPTSELAALPAEAILGVDAPEETGDPAGGAPPGVAPAEVASAGVAPAEQEAGIEQAAGVAGPSKLAASLPAPPPRLSSAHSARRADRGTRTSAHRGPRSLVARLGAMVALLAAIAAVVLLLSSLLKSSHAKPAAAPAVVKVVIPEGETRLQIAQVASKAGLRGSYRVAAKHSSLLNPAHYGAPSHTPDLEGFLFPATYDEFPGAPASRLVADQLTAFKENFTAALTARARALHVTPYQLLIVASMIEREAQVPGDRAKIAAVIYNRLRQEIPLGIDATIYYAVELQRNVPTYTQELTEAQLHINSPYNTRIHVGLPPTPISNPGLASIEAAANPAHANYLYYVAGADGCGEQVFSTTLAAFEANVAAYNAAVKKYGGHPPTCKK